MASETSDLTFVRCPTCRSLVPASASRCRICNATLEAGGKASGDANAGANRVRQKTVSATPDEVASMISAGAPQPSAPPPPAQPVEPLAPADDPFGSNDDGFDPLGAYLQDLDSEPSQPPVAATPSATAPADDGLEDLDDLDDFDLDIFDEPPVEKPFEKKASRAEPIEPGIDLIEPSFEDDAAPPPAPPKQVAPPPRREDPRPPRQENRPSRESAPAQKPQNPQPVRPKMAPPRNEQRFQAPKPRDERPAPKQQPQRPAEDKDQRRNNQPATPAKVAPQQAAQRQQPKPPSRDAQPAREDVHARHEDRDGRRPHAGSGPRAGRVQPGRLFGWLVSFENPDGRAIELRGGRFFITGSNIRESDLILEDQSISTPHALMSIKDRGLMIQDLMSERGTFIRSSGDSQYRREEGIIEVEHGDWIRFGDVEFLVVVVPSAE